MRSCKEINKLEMNSKESKFIIFIKLEKQNLKEKKSLMVYWLEKLGRNWNWNKGNN